MKRTTIANFLSLFTVFGGHCYNGRWAKALLFAVLLAASAILFPVAVLAVLSRTGISGDAGYQEMIGRAGGMKVLAVLVGIAVIAVWAASGLTAAMDARRRENEIAPEEVGDSPLMANLAALAACALGVAVLFAIPVLVSATLWLSKSLAVPVSTGTPYEIERVFDNLGLPSPRTDFFPYLPRTGYLGITGQFSGAGRDRPTTKLLAAGRGTIQGNVRASSQPVAGLQLRLRFAPDLASQWAVSDAAGRYSIPVPPGQYRLSGWEIDSSSANSVLSGKINVDQFTPFDAIFTAIANAPTTGPDFDFVDPVIRVKPIGGVHVPADVVFEWKPYPNAARYSVVLTDHGTAPGSLRILRGSSPRDATGTTVTAALLQYNLKPGHYYSWDVIAYDGGGRRLAECADGSSIAFRSE